MWPAFDGGGMPTTTHIRTGAAAALRPRRHDPRRPVPPRSGAVRQRVRRTAHPPHRGGAVHAPRHADAGARGRLPRRLRLAREAVRPAAPRPRLPRRSAHRLRRLARVPLRHRRLRPRRHAGLRGRGRRGLLRLGPRDRDRRGAGARVRLLARRPLRPGPRARRAAPAARRDRAGLGARPLRRAARRRLHQPAPPRRPRPVHRHHRSDHRRGLAGLDGRRQPGGAGERLRHTLHRRSRAPGRTSPSPPRCSAGASCATAARSAAGASRPTSAAG